MKPLKEMENLKKETRKALKKFYKQLDKLEEAQTPDEERPMRHTPTEEEAEALEKFRKFLVKQEKFVLVDILTTMEIGRDQPDQPAKKYRTAKQHRIESDSHKKIVSEILDMDNKRDVLDKGLEILNQHDVSI